MRTLTKRSLASLPAVALALAMALSACAPPAARQQEAVPSLGVQVAWPSADSSLATLAGGAPAVNHPDAKPRPTASVAKVITILTVLQKHPLAAGQPGPSLKLDAGDVELYNHTTSVGGSSLLVHEGMVMSQHAMLEAMLLPSANNVADSLALWAFGSMEAYRSAATDYVRSLGMKSTTIGTDASGFSPSTTSTAGDLALLARAAMKEPVVAEIAAQGTAVIPGYGPVQNTNTLLGTSGVVGLKTGTSPDAGGVFLFAANVTLKGSATLLVGAVMGAGDTAADAMDETGKLLASVRDAPIGTGSGVSLGTATGVAP